MATGTIYAGYDNYQRLQNSANLDNITYSTNNIYYWYSAPQNAPESVDNGFMIVKKNPADGRVAQIVYTFKNIYIRVHFGTSWEPWYKFTGTALN